MDLYEHRLTMVEPGRFREYRQLYLEQTWPRLAEAGLRPLCLLNPTIGGMPEEVHSFVGFPSWDDWQRGQEIIVGLGDDAYRELRSGLVVSETVQPQIAFSGRPLEPETPLEDRRAVYGLRRWTIDPANWDLFTDLSENGVWPAMDAMDHRVLGQFRDAALTDPLLVTNLAGYRSVSHWHETRFAMDPAYGVPEELRDLLAERGRQRNAIVRHTWVQLMIAHWPSEDEAEVEAGGAPPSFRATFPRGA